jgi:hypothetical protein
MIELHTNCYTRTPLLSALKCTLGKAVTGGESRGPDPPPEIFKSRNILAVNIVY